MLVIEPNNGAIVVTLIDFMKLKLLKFTRLDVKKDPLRFLKDVECICSTLECSIQWSVELVGFILKYVPRIWFVSFKGGRSSGSAPFSWEEFV